MLHIRQHIIHALKQRLGMSTILDEHINWAIEQQITQIPLYLRLRQQADTNSAERITKRRVNVSFFQW